MYRTLRETTSAIRTELKQHGITSRQVSVKGRYCGYSDSITATIKDIKVSKQLVESIVNKYYSVDRDERTGEIIEGGNTYTHTYFDADALEKAAEEFITLANDWIARNPDTGEETGAHVLDNEIHTVVYWNHHPRYPFHPFAELKKKRMAEYNGEQWETSDTIASCRFVEPAKLAEALAIWKYQYNLAI